MPWSLKRFQKSRQLHFLTFSCYRRQPKFATTDSRWVFECALERGTLAQAVQSLKQGVARRLALRAEESFWQARYYDFNVWSERKLVEKLRYIHRNPVTRGLVGRPEDWSGVVFATT